MAYTRNQRLFGIEFLKKHAFAFGIAGGIALAALSAAGAEEPDSSYRGSQADQQACQDDVFRLCGEFVPDEPRIIACMKVHIANLSPACKAVFTRDTPQPARKKRRST